MKNTVKLEQFVALLEQFVALKEKDLQKIQGGEMRKSNNNFFNFLRRI